MSEGELRALASYVELPEERDLAHALPWHTRAETALALALTHHARAPLASRIGSAR